MKKKVIWLVASCLMALALVLASCGPATEEEGEQPDGKVNMMELTLTRLDGTVLKKSLEKPQYGGELNMALSTGPLYFDPTRGLSAYTPCHLTHEELTGGDWLRSPTGTGEASYVYDMYLFPFGLAAPCLAESWELDDPETIVYHIRHGVHWQNKAPINGRELIADDVVFTLLRYWQTPGCYHAAAYPYDDYIESITAPDKWTVIIKCRPGQTGMVYQMAGDLSHILPPEVIKEYGDMNEWENSVGTGPFMLTGYLEGSSVTYTRNPDYWRKNPLFPDDQLPYLASVKQLIIPDLSTRMSALRTAKVDWMEPGISWEDAGSLTKTNPELKYMKYLQGAGVSLNWRVDKPELPFSDIRVRRALHMAINLQEIADTYYGGDAELLSWPVGPIPEMVTAGLFVPLDKLPQPVRELFEYNPDKAKSLLTEAGYPDGFKTEIITITQNVDLLSIVKDYWSKVGVDLDIQVKEYGAYTSILGQYTYEQMITWGAYSTQPLRFNETRWPSVQNYGRVQDERMNAAYQRSIDLYFNIPERIENFQEILPYMLEQAWFVQLPQPYVYTFWQPWVKGYSGEQTLSCLNKYNAITYVWLDQKLKEEMTGTK